MMKRLNARILTIIIREMGKLNIHSPIYYMKDNWECIRPAFLEVWYLKIGLYTVDNEVV